jgi:hypothetical protein
MGPRLHAFMAILNKKFGLSHGKIQSLLQDFFQEAEKDRHFSERLGGDGERLEPGRGDRG